MNLTTDMSDSEKTLLNFVAKVSGSSEKRYDKWLINSGASTHMCNDASAFEALQKKSFGRTVTISDGSDL